MCSVGEKFPLQFSQRRTARTIYYRVMSRRERSEALVDRYKEGLEALFGPLHEKELQQEKEHGMKGGPLKSLLDIKNLYVKQCTQLHDDNVRLRTQLDDLQNKYDDLKNEHNELLVRHDQLWKQFEQSDREKNEQIKKMQAQIDELMKSRVLEKESKKETEEEEQNIKVEKSSKKEVIEKRVKTEAKRKKNVVRPPSKNKKNSSPQPVRPKKKVEKKVVGYNAQRILGHKSRTPSPTNNKNERVGPVSKISLKDFKKKQKKNKT